MKIKRTIIAPALVATVTLVSGGWLLQRGGPERENVYQQARVFDEVLHLLSDRHVEGRESSELYRMAVDGMIRELGDPHTNFMTPEQYAELYTQMSGEYAGIGAQVAERDGWSTIIAPLPGTPAKQAGVLAGDRIVEVDGTSTEGMSNDEVVKLLRGPRGEPVTMKVVRFGSAEPITFRIVRDEIHLQSVPYAYSISDGVGYVRLTMFAETSTQELRAAIQKLRAEGARKLILDLRENPGGLLEQGVRVSDLFLKAGDVVVETRGRSRRESMTARATTAEVFPGMPVVVLVDEYSASAAEIVAGALQDHDRALVVGTTSFGKGSVQDLLPLSGGNFLKVTTAKWYTPAGRSIQKDRQRKGDPTALVEETTVDESGRPIPDAVTDTTRRKPYRTDGGRIVYGGGGIVPDVILLPDTLTESEKEFSRAVSRSGGKFFDVLFRYAIEYGRENPRLRPDFQVTAPMLEEFYERMRAAGIEVTPEQYEGARSLMQLRIGQEIAQRNFSDAVAAQRANASDRVVAGALDMLRRADTQQALFQVAEMRGATAGR